MKPRSRMVLVAGALLAGVLLFARSPVRLGILRWSVLHADAPPEDALAEVLDRAGDAPALARQIWDTGKIVPRVELVDYLRRHAVEGSPLWPAVRPIVLQAARSGDVDQEQSALGLLERNDDPAAPALASLMLKDPDPEIRLIGLYYSNRSANTRFVPLLLAMLKDPDKRIQGCAEGVLCTLTGKDFGIKFDADVGITPNDAALWNGWWAQNHTEYPELADTQVDAAATPPQGAKAHDFSLRDLDGKVVRLADLRGKPVVLNFWDKRQDNCAKQVPQWIEFQRRHPEIVVVSISLDAIPEEEHHHMDGPPRPHGHGPTPPGPASQECEEMHDHSQMTASDESSPTEGRGDVASELRQFAELNHLNYPVLIDPTGQTALAYGADELPACVWIDKEGNVRRRMRLVTKAVAATLDSVAGDLSNAAKPM